MRIESVVWHDRIDRSRYEVRSDQVTIDGERMSPKDEGWVCHAGRLLIIDQANKNRQFLEANREAQARITELESQLKTLSKWNFGPDSIEWSWVKAAMEGVARITELEATRIQYAQALLLAWGGVCPPHWAIDGDPQAMAETIRREGDRIQTENESLKSRITELEAENAALNEAKIWSRDWYAVRWERLRDLLKDTDLWDQANCIIANGTASATEPPTYMQIINMQNHRIEALEKELEAAKTKDVKE